MAFRFRRRKSLLPGVQLNVGKRGASLSFGPRGMKKTIGPSGSRTTVGLPGTGISYTKTKGRRRAREDDAGVGWGATLLGIAIAVGLLWLVFG